jgi:hypothetical protein
MALTLIWDTLNLLAPGDSPSPRHGQQRFHSTREVPAMKCPRCWAPKAYARHVGGWKGLFMDCLFIQPMKCHHCFHKYLIPWFLVLGKEIHPPRTTPNAPRDPAAGSRSGRRRRPVAPPTRS